MLANKISSFLEDLLVYMEHSNNGTVQHSKMILLENSLNDVDEKAKSFFDKLRQDYERMGMGNKMKHVSVYKLALTSWGNLELELRENAMLYTIQNKVEELQRRLAETFAEIEGDGERLMEKLKEERRDTESLVKVERDKDEQESGVNTIFPDYMENKEKMQGGTFSLHVGNKSDMQQSVIFPKVQFPGQENLNQEREKLLQGMQFLREELKSVRAEIQQGCKRNRGRLFGKRRTDFNEEEEIPVGIKRLEGAIEAWCRELKEFRRNTRHFPCALDGFVSLESRSISRDFEIKGPVDRQIWYLTYMDELEIRIGTAEQQVKDFRIDANC